MIQEKIEKAKILLEALPYIKKFYGKTVIVKYGGSLRVDDALKASFATDIVLLKYVGINPIIVHGGGKEISKWMNRVGKEAVFINGLRVTDSETMEITEMVLTGKINNEVVSLINQAGGKAVGLSGKDANLIVARRNPNEELGFVGDVEEVDLTLLNTLCDKGYIPVIYSVAISREGETLNMNADHVAEGVAIALNALKLIYMTDVQGVLIEGKLRNFMSLAEAKELLKHPDIKGGMLPKLTCCISAIERGVGQVHIINGGIEHSVLLEIFTDIGIGTMIFRNR